jgi:hypothetical protein
MENGGKHTEHHSETVVESRLMQYRLVNNMGIENPHILKSSAVHLPVLYSSPYRKWEEESLKLFHLA